MITGKTIALTRQTVVEKEMSLLFGRKAMINLETALKGKDITLLTKVHIIKAMVFPVVMYRCKNWIIRKVER